MNHCLRHYEEPVAATCRACNHPFCTRCLVFSFGPKKPPYCVGCALHAAGVRNGQRVVDAPYEPPTDDAGLAFGAGGPPTSDKRVERAYRRAERDALKASAKAAKRASRKGAPAPVLADALTAPTERSSQVPAPSQLLARSAHDQSL